MATDYADLGFKVDSRGLLVADKRLESVTKSGEKTEKQIGELDKSFLSLRGAVGLASASLVSFGVGNKILETARNFDIFMAQLKTATGDIATARAEFENLSKFAASTPFDLGQSIDGFVKLKNLGLDPSIGSLKSYGNTASAMGKSLNQMIEAVADASTNEFERLKEFGIKSSQQGDRVTFTFRGVETTVLKSSEAIQGYLLNIGNVDFAGAMQDRAESLDGALSNLGDSWDGLFRAISSNGVGSLIHDNVMTATSALDYLAENIEALESSFEFLLYAGAGYATFMGGKYVASTLAAVSANQTQLASQAILDAGYKKSVAAKLAGDEAKIASELALTQVQRAAITQQILRTKSESTLTLLRAEQTRVTARMATAEAALSAASARTAAASGAATAASALATRALAAQTASAMVTTGAMNALGVATRFALGPWGLLIGAIGAAATVFVTSKNQADQLNEIIEKQKGAVSGLANGYEKLNKVGQARYWQQSNSVLAENLNRLQQINAQISKNEQSMSTGDSSTRQVMREINKRLSNEAQGLIAANDELRKTQQELFSKNMPDQWIDPSAGDSTNSTTKEINKQLASLQQMQKEVGMTSDQLFVFREQQKSIANKDLPATTAQITSMAESIAKLNRDADFTNLIKSLDDLSKQQSMHADEYEVYTAKMKAIEAGMTGEQVSQIEDRIRAVQRERRELQNASDYQDWISSVESAVDQLSPLQEEIIDIWQAMLGGKLSEDVGQKRIKQIEDQMKSLSKSASNPFEQMTGGAKEALSAMSGMFESGSKDAKKLAVAMSALNLVQAVGAVLNQGTGDPYTAFGRMASMAAMVASLGMSIGGLSGGFEDKSQAAQDSQGLNSWGDKSESIAKASEITASATDKLVGINTKMLSALRTMQQGILAASGLIARGARQNTIDTPQFTSGNIYKDMGINPKLGSIFDAASLGSVGFLFGGPIGAGIGAIFGSMLGNLLGGKSSVVNDGIRIVGGKINDLIDSVTVQAFQDVEYKKWRFGSTKSHRELMDISSTVGGQISLVFESMRDSVAAGAETLGYSQSYIESAINDFKVATTEISLKGLSAENQQKEIEAVFSSIFDNLAGSVIPFIDKFQIVGEGLGETLARVATQVAVTEEAALRFGITFGNKMANPEAFAMAADNLAMLTGGVDELASKVSSFTKFADEATQIEIAQNDLTRALSEVGLTLPGSTQGMWDLMSSLDGTTEAGREQIASLLNLQDSAMGYYQMLERQNEQYKNLSSSLRGIISNTYGLSQAASEASLDAALAAARLGDFSLALGGNFSGAMPSMSEFSSFADFAYEQAVTANKLEELAGLSDNQISVDERQLSELEKINESLRGSYQTKENKDALIEAIKELSRNQQLANSELAEMKRQSMKQSSALSVLATN